MKSFQQFNEDMQATVSHNQQAKINAEKERVANYRLRKQDELEKERDKEEITDKIVDRLKRELRNNN